MIGSFTLTDIALLVGLWFITSMISNLLWTRFVLLRYVGEAVMKWIDGLDKNAKAKPVLGKLFFLMFDWVGSARIKTGKKIKVKDEDGEISEVDEELSPVDMLAKVIAAYAYNKFRSGSGGTRAQLRRILEDEIATSSGGISPAAARALSKGHILPAITELIAPRIQQSLNKP